MLTAAREVRVAPQVDQRGLRPLVCLLCALASACDVAADLPAGVRRDAEDGWPGVPRSAEVRVRLGFRELPAGEVLTDFPLLVRVPAHVPQEATLRFLASDGGQLPFEIERWGPAPERIVWVRAPRVTVGEHLWLVFSLGGSPVSFEPRQVWSSGYVGVWHFAEPDSAPGVVKDSSPSALLGTFSGTTPRQRSPDGGGLGSHLVIQPGAFATVENGAPLRTTGFRSGMSLELWLSVSDAGTASQDIVSKMGLDQNRGWDLALESGDSLAFRTSADGRAVAYVGSTSVVLGRWYHVAGTLQAGAASRLYLDGELNDENQDGGVLLFDNALPVVFGAQSDPHVDPFSGLIDEVRLSDVTRSARWVKASYLSMRDELLEYGAPEFPTDAGPTPPDAGAALDAGAGDGGTSPDGGSADTSPVLRFASSGCAATPGGLLLPLGGLLFRRRGKR